MHESSMKIMERLLRQHVSDQAESTGSLVDVGSYNVNGSYREMALQVPGVNHYTGIDIRTGPNVDQVVTASGNWAEQSGMYDIVISGQCLEHVAAPWDWIKQVKSICKPGGLIILIAPWRHEYHPYPIDAWRIFLEGMRALLESADLVVKEVGFLEARGRLLGSWRTLRLAFPCPPPVRMKSQFDFDSYSPRGSHAGFLFIVGVWFFACWFSVVCSEHSGLNYSS